MTMISRCYRSIGVVAALVLAAAPSFGESYLIQNVNILPMDAPRILENQDILVRRGVIAAIGDSESLAVLPADAVTIDGKGGYVMPGLSDMHAHIRAYAGDDAESGDTGVAENQFLLYLATGVTLLRDPSGSPAHFSYRERIRSGALAGPDLYFTPTMLEGENAVWEDFAIRLLDPGEADSLIAGFAEQGYWGVKIYHTLSSEVFDAVMEAGARHGINIIGHVPFEVGIDRALLSGMYSIEHLRGYDFDGLSIEELAAEGGRSALRFSSMNRMSDERMNELVDLTLLAGTWNTPTLAISRFLFDTELRAEIANHPRFALVHPEMQESQVNSNMLDAIFSAESRAALRDVLPRAQELVRRLNERGAGILIGTDAVIPAYVPGFTPIDEIQTIAAGGLASFDVLQSATLKAAQSLGIDAERGTIAVGKKASLILLGGNPLEDLDNLWSLQGVLHQGEWRSLAAIESLLREQLAAH